MYQIFQSWKDFGVNFLLCLWWVFTELLSTCFGKEAMEPGQQEDSLEKNLTVESISDESSNQEGHPDEAESNGKKENESVKLLKEKLSAALINVSLKDELVNQHSKVAEEAVKGWEKAENEAAVLKQQLNTLAENNSALEARSSQLDQALKECVRQLRLAKDEQERKISEALALKNKEYELSKSKLEKQIVELQSKLEASPLKVDPEIHLKLGFLERENQRLKHELVSQYEELEIRTIERDLSTKAAETASKQNLESIKMVAKLESECRKLKAVSRKSPILDNMQKSPSASSNSFDSEAVAFMAGKIDLMDDFLEMEKLAAMPENGHHPKSELPHSPSKDIESLLREELKVIQCRAFELEKKVREMEAEKVDREMSSSQSQMSSENMQVELVETKMKLEKFEADLQEANELKMDYESYANDLKLEAQAMMSKIEQLQAEVDRQRVLSEKLSDRCQELETELYMKNEELEVERGASCSVELEEKERALDETRKRCDELENQYKEVVMRFDNQAAASRTQVKAKEAVLVETQKCLEEMQLKLKEAEMKLETQIAVYNNEVKEKETALAQSRERLEELQIQLKETENKLEKLQKVLHEEYVSKEHLMLDLTNARAQVETMSTQIDTLQVRIDQEHGISAELSAKCEELRKELKQKEQELGLRQNVPTSVEQKINQEDVANAAEKLAECQKTIASLGNQLKSLATLEDFLIDTASIPKFSGSAPLITNGGNELWKLHSNNVYLPQKRCDEYFQAPEGLHTFSKYVDGDVLDSSSSSSTKMYSISSSEKRANGYEKLFPMRKG
ncbi:hypothetical protein V2J09_007241 [Rumex salicifolius]